MKTILLAALSAALLVYAGASWAQDDADAPNWIPIETWACHFHDGKTMADLEPVIAEWNAWMDANEVTDYFASLAVPHYYGERNFDVAWLGGWTSGNAMGTGTDMWVTEGGEMGAKFFEVIDCSSHTNFASTVIKPPTGEPEDGDANLVLDFANCSAKDGKTFDEVMAGLSAWAEHQSANGFQNSTYMMFPIFGETDNDYAFKLVNSHSNHAALGADYELMGNGGHWLKEQELLAGLMSCDSPRVYDVRMLRAWAEDDAD